MTFNRRRPVGRGVTLSIAIFLLTACTVNGT